MTDEEMLEMLADHMGRGFLENIAALFRQEPPLGRFIPAMISREQIAVRLGTAALVEELARTGREALPPAVPGLLALLTYGNPTVRGDAASLLGTIGDPSTREAVAALLADENAAVREVAQMALEEMGGSKA